MKKLKGIYFEGKSENKIGNEIGDAGYTGIFNNEKCLSNLEKLYLCSI